MRKIYLLLFTVCIIVGMVNAQVGSIAATRQVSMRSRPSNNPPLRAGWNSNSFLNSVNKIAAPCPGATGVPYTENFDGVAAPSLPDCITVENVNGGNTWRTVDTDVPVSDPNLMRLDFEQDGVTPADAWFFTQGLNLIG